MYPIYPILMSDSMLGIFTDCDTVLYGIVPYSTVLHIDIRIVRYCVSERGGLCVGLSMIYQGTDKLKHLMAIEKNVVAFETRTRVLLESIVALVASTFFWGWALLLTVTTEYDTGLICFAATFLSGLGGFMLARGNKVPQRPLIIGTGVAFAFTTAVFISASIRNDEGSMHLAYLIVSAFIWSTFSVIFILDINRLYQETAIDIDQTHLVESDTRARMSNML